MDVFTLNWNCLEYIHSTFAKKLLKLDFIYCENSFKLCLKVQSCRLLFKDSVKIELIFVKIIIHTAQKLVFFSLVKVKTNKKIFFTFFSSVYTLSLKRIVMVPLVCRVPTLSTTIVICPKEKRNAGSGLIHEFVATSQRCPGTQSIFLVCGVWCHCWFALCSSCFRWAEPHRRFVLRVSCIQGWRACHNLAAHSFPPLFVTMCHCWDTGTSKGLG